MEPGLRRLKELMRELGLTDKEAEVYAAIYVKGSATVKELLEALRDIHQPQLYNVLSSLHRKGFIKASMGRPKRYSAISLDALVEARKARLDRLRVEAQRVAEEMRKLEEELGEGEAYVYMVKGYNSIEASVIEVLANAETEVCAELPAGIIAGVLPALESALRRGVLVHLLVFPRVEEWVAARLGGYGDIKVREHQLGSFLLVEADLRRAVYARRRFYSTRKTPIPDSEVYGFHIAERDLIWRLLSIWEEAWRYSRSVVSWPLEPSSYPKRFLEFGLSVYEVEDLIKAGYRPYVAVRGAYVRTREPVEIRGPVVAVRRSHDIWNFTVDTGEEELTVGGFDAEIEDVEAEEVVVERIVRVD